MIQPSLHPWASKFIECLPGIEVACAKLGYEFSPGFANELARAQAWPELQAILLDLMYQCRKDSRDTAIKLDILLARLWDVFPFK